MTRANPTDEHRGDALRQRYGIDGTMGDAQDVPHPYHDGGRGWCLLCGLGMSTWKHEVWAVEEALRTARLVEKAEMIASNTPELVVEHAIMMSGGGMQVRNSGEHIERIFPLAEWIPAQQRFGGKVYTRTVIVVADWHEVEQ